MGVTSLNTREASIISEFTGKGNEEKVQWSSQLGGETTRASLTGVSQRGGVSF